MNNDGFETAEPSDGNLSSSIHAGAAVIRASAHLVVFTGAGVSVESGIPPFRGETGIWSTYDPRMLQIDYFLRYPAACWGVIREIFYDFFGTAEPNAAHRILAEWERNGVAKALITQNIDNLHTRAGTSHIVEYHGNSRKLRCMNCGTIIEASADRLVNLPPECSCGGIFKPDFVFFGEGIPEKAARRAEREASAADVMLIIGTTGEVYPAASLPEIAKRNGAVIIEINPSASNYTESVTDILIPTGAVLGMSLLDRELENHYRSSP